MDWISFELGDGERISVNTPDRDALFADMDIRLAAGRGFSVATLNLDHLVKLRRSADFRHAYAAHTHVVADGNPIVWIARLARRRVRLCPGCELVEPICDLALRHGASVALFGSTERALARAETHLRARRPRLEIAARIAPSGDFDPRGAEAEAGIERLRRSGARVCFVALGAPKQELFVARAQAALPEVGFISVGAGLDFLAGTQRRAPVLMRRLPLEWLWRALSDPRRLAPRYVRCGLLLPGLILQSMRGRMAPQPIPAEDLQRL